LYNSPSTTWCVHIALYWDAFVIGSRVYSVNASFIVSFIVNIIRVNGFRFMFIRAEIYAVMSLFNVTRSAFLATSILFESNRQFEILANIFSMYSSVSDDLSKSYSLLISQYIGMDYTYYTINKKNTINHLESFPLKTAQFTINEYNSRWKSIYPCVLCVLPCRYLSDIFYCLPHFRRKKRI
jgi:hypothetical protein